VDAHDLAYCAMTSFQRSAVSSGSVATPAFCLASSTTWSNSSLGIPNTMLPNIAMKRR